jgi:hypothetical protein
MLQESHVTCQKIAEDGSDPETGMPATGCALVPGWNSVGSDRSGPLCYWLGGVAGATAVVCVNDEFVVTVWPLGRVVVAVRVPAPPETDVTTLRSIVFPDAVVIAVYRSHVPGDSLVSVPE